MTIICPKCQQRYDLATARLKGKDRMATCGKCGHRFTVQLPGAARGAGAPTAGGAPTAAGAAVRTGTPARPPLENMTMVGRPGTQSGQGPAPHVRIAFTVLDGSQKEQVFQVTRPITVIGRVEGEVRLTDPRVSGRHAQVELSGGEVWLRDLGSTNGTFVNGARIDLVRLNHLDEVTVGATRLLYTCIQDFVSAYDAFSPGS